MPANTKTVPPVPPVAVPTTLTVEAPCVVPVLVNAPVTVFTARETAVVIPLVALVM